MQYRKLQNIFEFASFATAEMKLNTNYTFYSIVIFSAIVFDLSFTETLVIDTPFLIILTTYEKNPLH